MQIGICKIKIHLPCAQNLKQKRQIVKSLCDRIRARFHVSIAEIDHQDQWQLATIGIACIDAKTTDPVLNKIIDFIRLQTGNFELCDHQIELIGENIC